MTFKTPADCVKHLEQGLWKVPYGARKKGQQVQCAACKRWKYSNERCNLFTTATTPCNCRADQDGAWLDINCQQHGNRYKQQPSGGAEHG